MAIGPQAQEVEDRLNRQVKEIEAEADRVIMLAAERGEISPVVVSLEVLPGVEVQIRLRTLYEKAGWTQILFHAPEGFRESPRMVLHA